MNYIFITILFENCKLDCRFVMPQQKRTYDNAGLNDDQSVLNSQNSAIKTTKLSQCNETKPLGLLTSSLTKDQDIAGISDTESCSSLDSETWEEVVDPDIPPESSTIEILCSEVITKPKEKRQGITRQQRKQHSTLHKVHLLTLLSAALHRNAKCCNAMLQSMLMSLLPFHLIQGIETLRQQKSPTLPYLTDLLQWWCRQLDLPKHTNIDFKNVSSINSRCFQVLQDFGLSNHEEKSNDTETFTLGFVALCRSIGLDIRLVVALYPIPLSLSLKKMDAVHNPLNLWCEVYSWDQQLWIPLRIESCTVYDPLRPWDAIEQKSLCYVIALEPCNIIKEVTRRYASLWSTTTRKLRLPLKESGDGWWKLSLWFYSKSFKSTRDEHEDNVTSILQLTESMPNTFSGFVDHPLYALERHCKQNQVIYPNGKKHIVGTFKGEPIYPRTHVQTIRSSESWKRFGYQIKSGESGVVLKQKSLADSSKSFNIEDQDMFIDSNETNGSVWLYGEWQTEPLEPLALIDGIIPRNDFGNIEIFHPRMIPRGAVHIRGTQIGVDSLSIKRMVLNRICVDLSFVLVGKGACHIAKQLEIDYASAITGFQFGRGKPIPLLDGIIVTAENGEIILEVSIYLLNSLAYFLLCSGR
ncbi:hypothetical protein RTP6_003858 [Batrachochytrium dendrobatidis]